MRRILTIWIILQSVFSVCAQDINHTITNYSIIDGIPQSQVTSLVEDNLGYLWIGTMGGGLARFDGEEFVVYTTLDGLFSNVIRDLWFDSNDNLWLLHPRGFTRFDGAGFTKIRKSDSQLPGDRVLTLFEEKKEIKLISYSGRIGSIVNDSVYYDDFSIFGEHKIRQFYKSPNGIVYVYLSDGNIYTIGNKKLSEGIPAADVGMLYCFFTHKNEVWVQTKKGHFKIDTNAAKLIAMPGTNKGIVLHFDPDENVYWTQYKGAIMREEFTHDGIKIDTVIRDVEVNKVLMDREGSTWIASNGGGLFRYFAQDFERCSSENLKGVMAIHIDKKGREWIGSFSKGLWRMKDKKVDHYADARYSYRNMVNCISESNAGVIWVGTYYGLGRYNESTNDFTWYTMEDGLAANGVFNINFDHNDVMWIGTGRGINRYENGQFTTYQIDNENLSKGILSAYYSKRENQLYVGTENGVSTLKDGTFTVLPLSGIENTSVLCIEPYLDSLLLFGTGGAGMIIFNPKTRGQTFITSHEGLASDFIYFSTSDQDGYIWVGTEKGINRIKLDESFTVVEIIHYNNKNGLKGVETNQNAFYIKGNDKHFGLVDGIYEFKNVPRDHYRSFSPHLTDVQIYYNDYDIHQFSDSVTGFYKIPYALTLPPNRNHITFQFNKVDKLSPKSVRYKYFLEGFDKHWSKPITNDQVTYSSLPPGVYTFKLVSTNRKGAWGDEVLEYSFVINTPFYQKISFILSVVILLAGLITLFFYLRVRHRVHKMLELERIRLEEQESLRKEIARDFHDEMGNQLTRIINYVSLLNLNGKAQQSGLKQSELYKKVEDSAKFLYSGTRDFIWAIDPVNDELSKLFLHIRDFGEKLFEEKNIPFRANSAFSGIKRLPYGFSREANLIFKEVMTNAFKHSGASNISLSLNTNGEGYEIILEDDGSGFVFSEIEANGLRNIRERADRIGAILRISSKPGTGTKVILSFDLVKSRKYGAF